MRPALALVGRRAIDAGSETDGAVAVRSPSSPVTLYQPLVVLTAEAGCDLGTPITSDSRGATAAL